MPRTRRARTAAKPSLLLELPDELLTHVATLLLEVDLTAALRLVQACKALSSRLATIQQAAGKRRMRWLPEFTNGHAIEDGGLLNAMVRETGKSLMLYCAYGERSALALKALKEAGFEKVTHLSGGMNAWVSAGAPTQASSVT